MKKTTVTGTFTWETFHDGPAGTREEAKYLMDQIGKMLSEEVGKGLGLTTNLAFKVSDVTETPS